MDTRHHGSQPSNKPLVFSKMESLVREMQDAETGIPIRPQKIFLTSIPSAFMGYDLIEWLLDRLDMEDSAEAIHLANLLCQYGYFFPVGETRSLIVKDDSSLYRFQTPYYWPSQNHSADSTDYAIYLTKRLSRNRQKHGLEEYEMESYQKLKRSLQHKWDFITMQAEEQVRLSRDRKKGDKIVTDSQERAYWRVYRPPPGFNNCLESAPVPDRANVANRVRKKTYEERKKELEFYKEQIGRTRMKTSVANEGLIGHFETYWEFDYFIVTPQPSSPWITEDIAFWVQNENLVEFPTEKRAKRWAISFHELVSDPTGIMEFTNYLRKLYCHENIRFWQAVIELRYGSSAQVLEKVRQIYDEFLIPGAPCEINIDGKTMEQTQQQMVNPNRYTYDAAAEHVYVLLLKKDCYPKFLRSEHYKYIMANAVQPSQKKRFTFSFGGPGKKKISTAVGANSAVLAQTPQTTLKRHGSDEHAPGPSGVPHVASETSLPSQPPQPRVDCDPPYSASGVQPDQMDDICPWDTPKAGLSVVPYKSESSLISKLLQEPDKPVLRKEEKKSDESLDKPSSSKSGHSRQHHSLPHNIPTKPYVPSVKPPKPDRSQSVEASSTAPWQGPGTSSASNVPAEKSYKDVTSLAPSAYPFAERRASEGSRLLADRKSLPIVPYYKETVYFEEQSSAESTSSSQQQLDVVGVKVDPAPEEAAAVAPAASQKRPKTPVGDKHKIDYTIKSGHIPGSSTTSQGIDLLVSTSTAPFTVGTTTKTTTQSSSTSQPIFSSAESSSSQKDASSTKKCKGSPKTPKKDASNWNQQNPNQQSTEVCPWEDDSLTPTWL